MEHQQINHQSTQDFKATTSTTVSKTATKAIIAAVVVGCILAIIAIILSITLSSSTSSTSSQPLTVTIVGTNDIHGGYYPTGFVRKDNREKYGYGGLGIMASLIEIIKKQNGENFLYIDGGDQFQGGLQNSNLVSSGLIMTEYYNHLNTAASAPGNHEFDFGPVFLQNFLTKLNNKILSANLVDSNFEQGNSKYRPLYKQQKSSLFTFPILKNSPSYGLKQVKIGVIGLTTTQTPTKTSGFIQNLFPVSYKFLAYRDIIIEQSKKLKQQGAHAIIITGHVGNDCGNDATYGIWTPDNMGNIAQCNMTDEIFSLIDSLPQDTIHAVIQGHRHTISHYFYKGIPIIGTTNGGFYLNSIQLKFNIIANDQIKLDLTKTTIQGPIPVCDKVFTNTKKCEYVKPQNLATAGSLTQWKFHGVTVTKDKQLDAIIQSKWGSMMEQYQVQIASNFIAEPIGKNYSANAPISKLIPSLLAAALKKQSTAFDFVILNGGGFRTTWYPGVIRYAQFHSMFPFENTISYFDITGANLRLLLTKIQNGAKKFYPQWGLSHTLKLNTITSKYEITSLTLANGTPIVDGNTYTGATIKFITNGGDDFAGTTGYFTNINHTTISMKQKVKEQMILLKEITEEHLKNPTNKEWLIFE